MMRTRFWPNRLLIVTLGALSLAACFGGKNSVKNQSVFQHFS